MTLRHRLLSHSTCGKCAGPLIGGGSKYFLCIKGNLFFSTVVRFLLRVMQQVSTRSEWKCPSVVGNSASEILEFIKISVDAQNSLIHRSSFDIPQFRRCSCARRSSIAVPCSSLKRYRKSVGASASRRCVARIATRSGRCRRNRPSVTRGLPDHVTSPDWWRRLLPGHMCTWPTDLDCRRERPCARALLKIPHEGRRTRECLHHKQNNYRWKTCVTGSRFGLYCGMGVRTPFWKSKGVTARSSKLTRSCAAPRTVESHGRWSGLLTGCCR
jgi:hypothetical protein